MRTPERAWQIVFSTGVVLFVFAHSLAAANEPPELTPQIPGHPRLYCTAEELPKLRGRKSSGVHARIWQNLTKSADW